MAHVEENNSSGRSSHVEVNIVPFIDLMSVLIIFLLVSAVWTQVSMIQIGSSLYGKQTHEKEEIKIPPQVEIPFRIDVKESGYNVIFGKENVFISKVGGEYDKKKLREELLRVKAEYQEKKDVVLTMSDELKYEYLIVAMDEILQAGFPEISIATGGVR